jgi:NAD(P)-dependent dehydrogenase (short-subunit alcohol dehydrogenase family)
MTIKLNFNQGAVIVAGGSGGIGETICMGMAKAGLPVVFTYHSSESKAAAVSAKIEAAGGSCEYHQVDLSQPPQVEALFTSVVAKYETVSNVIYAAGPHFEFNYIGSIPNEEWHQVVNADINGAFHLIQSAVACFRKQGGGNLVAVITAAVERVPIKDIMSAAPKAAIEMLMRGVAKESGRFGIRANCVGPGWVNVGLGKKGIEEKLDETARQHILKTTIPMQRFGEGDDIANAVLFLCSKEAGYITGQSIAVDGGLQL